MKSDSTFPPDLRKIQFLTSVSLENIERLVFVYLFKCSWDRGFEILFIGALRGKRFDQKQSLHPKEDVALVC